MGAFSSGITSRVRAFETPLVGPASTIRTSYRPFCRFAGSVTVAFVSVTLPTNPEILVVPPGPSNRTPCAVVVNPIPFRTSEVGGVSSAVRIGVTNDSQGETVNVRADPVLPLNATWTLSLGPASSVSGRSNR